MKATPASAAITRGVDPVWPGVPPFVVALGLISNPFPVTPDETNYFFTPAIEAIYEEMGHFIAMRKGFLLLTGDVGLGKTTLLRRLMASFDKSRYNTALILTSFLNQDELLEMVIRDFGLDVSLASRRIEHLAALNVFLLEESKQGKINVLFIDDAQALDADALDVIRQLSNLETAQSKLIQVVLCGQPELNDTLNQYGLRQVKSRIALHRQLKPLDAKQTLAYIHHRLRHAGAVNQIKITADGLQALFGSTGGFPRRIHHLMDRCLYALVAAGDREIGRNLVRRATADLGWSNPETLKNKTQIIQHNERLVASNVTPPVRFKIVWAGLIVLILATLGWYLGHSKKSAPTLANADHKPAVPAALIAAPLNWTSARSSYKDLAELAWPDASTVASAMQQIQNNIGTQTWQVLARQGDWATVCDERPVSAVLDADGSSWHVSFIESHWPIAPVALGLHNEFIGQTQTYLQSQHWLELTDIDSTMGPRTAAALAHFQVTEGLEGTGQFNLATAYRLSCRLAKSSASHRKS
jgi:type II secretory pathway predicted ATPase ExeA